ncbi:MAG: hypothetical protein ACRDF4_00065 [Rhabdochlamydiaceae bacterium]
MPKWKKGETEFSVSLGFNEVKGYWCTIPKPIVEKLGEPKRVLFSIKSNKIELSAEKDDQ